ncbi:MAG: hypothetical protein ACKOB4_00895, partial [Acidobacteriota bacterium]
MRTIRLLSLALVTTLALGQTPSPQESRESLLKRARELELQTAYVPPPGDPLEHHAAGLAKVICSAVFITGLDADFAAENVGYFTAPYAERAKLSRPVVDRSGKRVSVTLPNGTVRLAVYTGDQGCVALPKGAIRPSFTPVKVRPNLPAAAETAWPYRLRGAHQEPVDHPLATPSL